MPAFWDYVKMFLSFILVHEEKTENTLQAELDFFFFLTHKAVFMNDKGMCT